MNCIFALLLISASANLWYDSKPVIFWGKIPSGGATANVLVPIKGCLKKTTQVTLNGATQCPPSPPDQELLIAGTIASGTPAKSVVLTVTCADILANASNQDRVFYASQQDQNCKPKTCVDDSTPLVCKPTVCGAQSQWPAQCSGATSCVVNSCGCSAVYTDGQGGRVCDTLCPDKSSPYTCKENPCAYSSKDSLTCEGAATASFCLPSQCGGCRAQWYDVFGRPVCQPTQCAYPGANFGKGVAKLGFAIVNNVCKAVSGKKSPVALFSDLAQCTAACVCVENGFVDFGACGQDLGWTLIMGVCKQVSGCPELKTPIKQTFFATSAACSTACPNPKVPVKQASAASASTALAGADQTRCPPEKVVRCEVNPCFNARPPLCVEATQGQLSCIPDNCGNCTARWLRNGQPFQCPPSQPCLSPATNCCMNNIAPRNCSAFPCDKALCNGAASCSPDPCRGCMPSFKDQGGRDIPSNACRANVNPAAFIKCSAGETCCPSGFKPLQCIAPPDVLNKTCSQLSCGTNTMRNCSVDGCDSCSLQVADSKGKSITTQCKVAPPDVCSQIKCPSMPPQNCGMKPPQCDGWNIECIKDNCACNWRWFSVDMKPPSPECAAALTRCFAPNDCPQNFTCEALPPNTQTDAHPEIKKQLICTQEQCTCRPVWVPPQYGLRASCKPTDPGCCPDSLTPAMCPPDQAQWTCSKVACNGTTAAQCRPDGCNQCLLDVFDAQQNKIPRTQCRLNLVADMQRVCAKVKCPADAQRPSCGPRPSCYPADWALDCIVDPCSCRSMWIDQDVRTNVNPQCSRQIVMPCVAPENCPANFNCSDIPAEQLAQMDPNARNSLVCIQEPCTCRPVSTLPSMLPPGFRLPCKNGTCCTDGKGPLVCPSQLATAACAVAKCDGATIASCAPDGCNNCNIKVMGSNGAAIPVTSCRLPLNESAICPGVCPPQTGAPNCGARPAACPNDWKLRCIHDPCVCTRNIWVDEDLRVAEPACTAALQLALMGGPGGGPMGPQGITSNTGPQGPGPQGITSNTGPQGPGPKGPTGKGKGQR